MGETQFEMVDIDEFDAISIEVRFGEQRETVLPRPQKAEKYPAKLHAHKVKRHLGVSSGLIYLPGANETTWKDTDGEAPFRQARYAFYLSGANFPGVVSTYDIAKDELILWIPVREPAEVVWVGALPSIEECAARYDVDSVRNIENLKAYVDDLLDLERDPPTVYVIHESQRPKIGQRRSRAITSLNHHSLLPAMDVSRAVKTPYEISQIRKAVDISSEAHRAVQKSIRKLSNEAEVENVFLAKCRELGAKKQAYPPIAGSGENAAVLHYGANNQAFGDRQLMVLDAGAEFNCYASDVTRTFPLSGKFSDEAKKVYQIVSAMQDTCISVIKPGASWRDISFMAVDVALKGLLRIGILQPGKWGESPKPEAVRIFFMHGLGHLVGLDTHDVISGVNIHGLDAAGVAPSSKLSCFGGKSRGWEAMLSRPALPLEKDMVITVEPGIYFNRAYIEARLAESPYLDQYVNKTVLEKYYPVYGCRIEDCVLVTETGYENITKAPKGDEMIRVINGVA